MFKKSMIYIFTGFLATILLFTGKDYLFAKNHGKVFIHPTDTSEDKPAEQVYKNIQVLKGMPSSQLHPVMKFIANSLGVKCGFCHVSADSGPWPMEKDDKKEKQTAREMITMMKRINDDNFEGRQEVSCATCHNGNAKPVNYPPFSTEKFSVFVNKDSLPEASTVIDKYISSAGGKSAFEKFKTRITKGDMLMPDGKKEPAEILQSAPDRYYISKTTEYGPTLIGCNGPKGWIKLKFYLGELDEDDMMDVRKEGEFFRETNILNYDKLKVTGIQKIPSILPGTEERKAYEVRGTDNFGNFVKLYFDTETGMLLRSIYFKKNSFGSVAMETNYSDYRDVDGVKLPFVINWHGPGSNETIIISDIKNNVSVDDSKFEMPKE